MELGIGESLLIKAIVESTGRSSAVVRADLKKEGDLGLVAMVFLFLEFEITELRTTSRTPKIAKKPFSSPNR